MRKMGAVLKTISALLVLTFILALRSMAGPEFKTIDTAGLHALVVDNAYSLEGGRGKHFTVIDARPKEEYDKSHIFSAISIPTGDFEKMIDLLPKNKEAQLVVYTDVTKVETSTWAEKARSAGYGNIVIYSEGFPAWKKKNMPVISLKSGGN